MSAEVRILRDAAETDRAAAAEFARVAAAAILSGGRFSVALSGGSTPRGLYSVLAGDSDLREKVPWERTHVFWGDERPVPPDHPESNYRMAWETLLSRVPVPPGNVRRIRGEAAGADDDYEAALREFFRPAEGEFPRFDLVLLGLGTDGHTASLFPGTPALQERRRLAVWNPVEKLGTRRVTLTLPVLNAAAHVFFLVCGDGKAPALRGVLEGTAAPEPLPARRIRPERGRLIWFVDLPAARLLERPPS